MKKEKVLEYIEMRKKSINEYDKSYHPQETISLDYCAAVLAVVLEQHPKAKKFLINIKIP